MKVLENLLVSVLIICMLLSSCDKKGTDPKPALKEILTASKWQLNRVFMENPPGTGAIELTYTTFKSCELDDLFEFKADGSFTSDENGLPCIPVNNSIFFRLGGGSWSSSGDTSLRFQSGFLSHSYHIREFNKDWLDLTHISENYVGEKELYLYRFRAIH